MKLWIKTAKSGREEGTATVEKVSVAFKWMTVYIVMLLSVSILSVYANGHRWHNGDLNAIQYDISGEIAIFVCSAILIFIAGFRYYVGTDYGNYFVRYAYYRDHWIDYLRAFNEPGIKVIAKFGSLIYDSAVTMFVIAALLTVGLCVWTIKKYSIDFCFSMLIYLLAGCYGGCFNGVRQFLAMSIIFAGHRFIYEKKLIKYVFVIILAMSFHKTAIIMLPVYFIAGKGINFKTITATMIGSIVVRYSYDVLLSGMSFLRGAEVSSNFTYAMTAVNPLRIAVTFAPLLVVFVGKNSNALQDNETQFYVMFAIINAAISFATAQSAYLARATIFTEIYSTLMYPRLVKVFDRKSKKAATTIICIFFLIYWIISIRATGGAEFRWVFGNV